MKCATRTITCLCLGLLGGTTLLAQEKTRRALPTDEGGPLLAVEELNSDPAKLSTTVYYCANVCNNSTMIIGCDNREQGPTSNTAGISPWQLVGRLSGLGS